MPWVSTRAWRSGSRGRRAGAAGLTGNVSGIKNADPEELKRVASQPTSDFFFFVNDFTILRTLLPLVSRRVCTTAGGVPVALPCKLLPALAPWEPLSLPRPLTLDPNPPAQSPFQLVARPLAPETWCCLSPAASP